MSRLARIRVDQLAVSGLPPADARRAAAAFSAELRRLAGARSSDAAMGAPTGPLTLRVTAGDPRDIGTAAARSLFARLDRSGS